jgi:hypothetical protein
MVAAMDALGVDGAVLVSPFSMYRYDASYALEVYATHPDRFRLVKQTAAGSPVVARAYSRDWRQPSAVPAGSVCSPTRSFCNCSAGKSEGRCCALANSAARAPASDSTSRNSRIRDDGGVV